MELIQLKQYDMMGLLDSFSLMLGDALVERIPWLKRAFLVRVSLQEPLYKAWRQTLGTTHAMRFSKQPHS